MATRRTFIARLAASVVTLCAAASQPACTSAAPQRASGVQRVGYLAARHSTCLDPAEWEIVHGVAIRSVQRHPPLPTCRESRLIDALAARGHRLGETIEWLQVGPIKLVEWGAGGAEGDLLQPAAYLAARQPDVIVAEGEDATRAALSVTATIPIVASNVNDMVETGLVKNVARPERNVTGVSFRTSDLTIKRIELLKEAFPSVKRPILVHGTRPSDLAAIGLASDAARQLGLLPVRVPFVPSCGAPTVVTEPTYPPGVFGWGGMGGPGASEKIPLGGKPFPIAPDANSNAIVVCKSDNAFSEIAQNLDAAIQQGADSIVVTAALRMPEPLIDYLWLRHYSGRGLPGVFPTAEYDRVGAIVMREPFDLSAQVATYVDKLLRGARPGDLPIVSPAQLEIVVSLRTAQGLGLTIAPNALARATTVVP
jgi:putative ABC transport system substrate-binding protein